MNRVKVSKEVAEFIRNISNTVSLPKGKDFSVYNYLPFWFKETDDPEIFIEYSLDEMPDDLKEFLQEERDRFQVHPEEKKPLTTEECYQGERGDFRMTARGIVEWEANEDGRFLLFRHAVIHVGMDEPAQLSQDNKDAANKRRKELWG